MLSNCQSFSSTEDNSMPPTSCSPTRICNVLPFGMTCAKSFSLNVCLSCLSGCTRRLSTSSGLKRPPARSFDRSFFNLSVMLAMSFSRPEKSYGSSTTADSPLEFASAFFSSRAALPPFLARHCEVVNVRMLGLTVRWCNESRDCVVCLHDRVAPSDGVFLSHHSQGIVLLGADTKTYSDLRRTGAGDFRMRASRHSFPNKQ